MDRWIVEVWPMGGGFRTIEVEAKDAAHARKKIISRKAFKGALTGTPKKVGDEVIKTEDGVVVYEGDRAYNYYDMKPGKIVSDLDDQGWFTFRHDDGSTTNLNGQRICSMAYALRRGFPGATS